MNITVNTFLDRQTTKEKNDISTRVILINKDNSKETAFSFSDALPKWQQEQLNREQKTSFAGQNGPTIVKFVNFKVNENDYGLTSQSHYAIARESMADIANDIVSHNSKDILVEFFGFDNDSITGAIVGIDLSLYRFENSKITGNFSFKKDSKKLSDSIIVKAIAISHGVNQARHLVNLPPNKLNPRTYAEGITKLFKKSKNVKVTTIDEKILKKEGCGLILSVGQASENSSRIVKISYRNAKTKSHIAFVGKGITFDSGGLDVKSAVGMRLMKKDMGGSATLVGLAVWLDTAKPKKNIDIYLALAENAISDEATRPSDIITAKNGMTVEIHNTDAEGRLVMADAISMAIENKPSELIDVATLTGAGKVALGQDIASLFSNDDGLADKLLKSGQLAGDIAWRMPLYDPYFKGLKSEFADMQNAASGHGGAITAALFLKKFVGKTKWAHFDIFGWTSGAKPSLVQRGGSGQGVELLIQYLK